MADRAKKPTAKPEALEPKESLPASTTDMTAGTQPHAPAVPVAEEVPTFDDEAKTLELDGEKLEVAAGPIAVTSYWVTDRGAVEHDNKRYASGDPIDLSDDAAKPLLAIGAIVTRT